MPLPCELPLSGSSSNPVSLPGAIAALSAQVTSTLLEVREEIGELKCEFVQVRGLAIQLASSLINEQAQRLKLEFAQLKLEFVNTENKERVLALIIQLSVSIIKQEIQKIKNLFDQATEIDLKTTKQQETISVFATSILANQRQILLLNT